MLMKENLDFLLTPVRGVVKRRKVHKEIGGGGGRGVGLRLLRKDVTFSMPKVGMFRLNQNLHLI